MAKLFKLAARLIFVIVAGQQVLHRAVELVRLLSFLIEQGLDLLSTLRSDVLRDFVGLKDFLGNLDEACLEIPQLLHEQLLEPLQILLFLEQTRLEHLVGSLKLLLFECDFGCQLCAKRHELGINLDIG